MNARSAAGVAALGRLCSARPVLRRALPCLRARRSLPYAESRRYTPEDRPKEVLAALHARLGLGRAVLVQASCHGTDNRAMLDALRSDPTRYRGVAMIDDETPDAALAEMHEAGVRGIRFNFIKALGGGPDLAVVRRAADRVRGLGWHVVLHLQGMAWRRWRRPSARCACPW
ncbi:amidohydrolase family protein [Pseudoroseomonas wenyumeiae]